MSASDREKWNERWQARDPLVEPSSFLVQAAHHLPDDARVLDVAGGTGRHAFWLATRGLTVHVVDVSDVAVTAVHQRAADTGLAVTAHRLDLETDDLPPGPWDAVLDFHYLQRDLFPAFARVLCPGGVLLFCQPTVRNLERHDRPSARFLLAVGEARQLIEAAGFTVVEEDEGWSDEDRHEARIVARA